MDKCYSCKWYFSDLSVGYIDCEKTGSFTDAEYDEYVENGYIDKCPYYEEMEARWQ